jgi:hypothetical protein
VDEDDPFEDFAGTDDRFLVSPVQTPSSADAKAKAAGVNHNLLVWIKINFSK